MGSPATPYLQVTWSSQILDQNSAQKGLNNGDAHLGMVAARIFKFSMQIEHEGLIWKKMEIRSSQVG